VPGQPRAPFTPGYDIVGVVDELGPGVSSLGVGQMVGALLDAGGGYAEFVCLPADRLVALPSGLDPAEAVGVALNYFVAHQMLHRIARVERGEKILVHGAAGGVGIALLQLGRLAELEVYGTASGPKHRLVSDLGGIPIDYRNEDFVARVRGLPGRGVDAVFDPIGGTNFWRSYRALRAGGRLVAYGTSSAAKGGRGNKLVAVSSFVLTMLLQLLPDRRSVAFYTAGSLEKSQPNSYREDLEEIFDLLARKEIQPIIAGRLPLAEASRAHEMLDRSAVSGKIVLTCNDT
jgi:NADPH:quinone reductase-like Zn-dependent oxidoreductase